MPYGISPTMESTIKLTSGCFLVFPSMSANSEGADYVRVVNPQGGEIAYWNWEEWEEAPIPVVGAILGCAQHPEHPRQQPKFYKMFPDCKFPDNVKLEE